MRIFQAKESDPLRIMQSKGGLRRSFKFEDDYLVYTITSRAVDAEFSIAYEAINILQRSTKRIKQTAFSARMYIYAGLLFIASVIIGKSDGSAEISLAMAACAGCLALAVYVGRWMGWLSVTITLFNFHPPPPGIGEALVIIHDRQFDKVMSLLEGRWRARMKALHGEANLHADPQTEAARLAWLRKNDIIDETHLREQLDRLGIVQMAQHHGRSIN